jgi:GDP-mannose 6-dehydrogenase
MRIAAVGLGYVGSVAGACFAATGHDVTFVEVNRTKVEQINSGTSPVVEAGLPELIRDGWRSGRLRATDDLGAAIADGDVAIVCVGTPTGRNGDVSLDDIERVCRQIGMALAECTRPFLVVVTSTVPPGTTEQLIIPTLEKESGKTCGLDFGVAFSPEFLREGVAVSDFLHPQLTVLGASDERALRTATELYRPFGGEVCTVPIGVAETVKLVGNAWHALKVVFANEVGRFCESQGIDSRAVMDVFKHDTRLNVSTAYLNPGFAFGGSCLPKDLRTLNYRAHANGVELPVLQNVLRSNSVQVEFALQKVEQYSCQRVAVLGLAFKHGTDDLRESPILHLVERLIGKGYDVRLHDDAVQLPRLVGVNRAHLLRALPHVARLLRDDVADAVEGAEIIVVAQGNPAYSAVLENLVPGQKVLDLVGVAAGVAAADQYRGLLW